MAATASASTLASAARTVPPASPFAELLRRSKFATYDPAIKQVYTSYGGDVHRGNWGFKRPLPLRRRNAFITVHTVDSKEQQTEFNRSESQARFIRRWEELATSPAIAPGSSWEKKLGKERFKWLVDSEFAPGTEDVVRKPMRKVKEDDLEEMAEKNTPVPNIRAMTTKEFERYLQKLRSLRPAFREYVEKKVDHDERLAGKSLFELGQSSASAHHRTFIARQVIESQKLPTSRNVEQHPHRTGGLIYAHPSRLESMLFTKAQPGLVLQKVYHNQGRNHSRPDNGLITSFGGLASTLKFDDAGGRTPLLDLDYEEGIRRQLAENSIAALRLQQATLSEVPRVVGRHKQGLKAMDLTTRVVTQDKVDHGNENPYKPGTIQYITMMDSKTEVKQKPLIPIRKPRPFSEPKFRSPAGSAGIINTLINIIGSKADHNDPL